MRQYNLKAEILTPIHIGTGKNLEPINYVIKNGILYYINFNKLIYNMDALNRIKFEECIDTSNWLSIREYIIGIEKIEEFSKYNAPVSSFVENKYQLCLHNHNNQLLISPFVRMSSRPYIPGSTLKGAIRTALINSLASNSNIPHPKGWNEEKYFEYTVLNYRDAKNDPFRTIKISDSIIDPNSIVIRHVKNTSKKNNNQKSHFQMFYEMTNSMITGDRFIFKINLNIDTDLQDKTFIKRKITIDDIRTSCISFYRDKLNMEHNKFYKKTNTESISLQLLNIDFKDNEFLLRLGRFCGVESVTIDKYRNPKPPGKTKIWGTTRNLAEGLYPMGWVKISIQ